MTKPYQHWNVLPHGTLVEIDDGILAVVGQISMPLMNLPRRMTVVRLSAGRAHAERNDAGAERPGRPHPQSLGHRRLAAPPRRLCRRHGADSAVVKLALIKGKDSLRAQLLQWADVESLKRVLVSHGEPIEANPRQVLRELAGSLT